MLSMARVEDEMKALEDKLKKTSDDLEKEQKLRKDLEGQNVKLLTEKNALFLTLESERGGSGDLEERLQRTVAQKGDLEHQLQVCNSNAIPSHRWDLLMNVQKVEQSLSPSHPFTDVFIFSTSHLNCGPFFH